MEANLFIYFMEGGVWFYSEMNKIAYTFESIYGANYDVMNFNKMALIQKVWNIFKSYFQGSQLKFIGCEGLLLNIRMELLIFFSARYVLLVTLAFIRLIF